MLDASQIANRVIEQWDNHDKFRELEANKSLYSNGVEPNDVAVARALLATAVERDEAVKMLADWCVAIDVNGTGWDDWDEHFKDAAYRNTKTPTLRARLDTAIERSKAARSRW